MQDSSEELFRERLRVSIPPLLSRVKAFLNNTTTGNAVALVGEEEFRAIAESLLRLGFNQDARHLMETGRALLEWSLGPGFHETLALWAAEKPDESQWIRETFGNFPSAEELAASVEHRNARVQVVHRFGPQLAKQLEELQTMLSAVQTDVEAPSTPSAIGNTTEQGRPAAGQATDQESLAITLLFRRPDMLFPEIAQAVGVERQTLYKWPKFLEAAERAGKYTPRRRGGNIPHGSKAKDGSVEAWRDDEPEEE